MSDWIDELMEKQTATVVCCSRDEFLWLLRIAVRAREFEQVADKNVSTDDGSGRSLADRHAWTEARRVLRSALKGGE